ncbi:uncharacterized protein LOC113921491 isoform X1 [Zalophus californianus]|uniref:Uncharacterized protein LOC113921491 isoform X1 n=1 Tax=Zalophus californianus TaxID=9704 RepID=A0A6J2CWC2_ZALCA|nr:uncharacterized protein LOC113921491 isoform X1 [Zalophus californianus]
MVRPDAQEQRSARRAVCPCARRATAAATQPAARLGFSFTGLLFYSRLLPRCTGFPRRVLGNGWPRDLRAVTWFLIAALERVSSSAGSARGVRPSVEPAPHRVLGAWRRRGPRRLARPPPSPHRGLGAGRAAGGATQETWQERGGDGPELLAGVGQGAGARLAASGTVLIALASGCNFAAHFLLSSGPGDALLSEQWRKRRPPPGPLRTSSFSRAAGHADDARPGRRLCLWSPALSGRARSGRAARRWAGSSGAARRGGEGSGRRPDVAAEEGRRRAAAASLALGLVRCLPDTMALAEVVVCAVGRVVTLPAVEITAQATALLVLVMLSVAEDNGWESPLFSGARGSPRSPGARPPRKPLVLRVPGGRKELRGVGRTGAFFRAGDRAQPWIRSLEGRSEIVPSSP